MRTDRNKDEQWPSSQEAGYEQNDKCLWKQYIPLRSVTRRHFSRMPIARFLTVRVFSEQFCLSQLGDMYKKIQVE